jgi:outer membrane protein OmpA-like peptidoglycan-associated protein
MNPYCLKAAFVCVLISSYLGSGSAASEDCVKNFSGMRVSANDIAAALSGTCLIKVRGLEQKAPVAASFDQITFEFNSAQLTPAARSFLEVVGAALAGEKLNALSFEVEGHTDAKGSEAYNLGLGGRRAAAVQEYLVSRAGIDPERLIPVPVGESDLLLPQDPNNAKNRRVVLRGVNEE